MVFMRIITMCWFLSSLRTTWTSEKDTSKRGFYTLFGIFGFLWFASFPLVSGCFPSSIRYPVLIRYSRHRS
jgi:hypothetical protein